MEKGIFVLGTDTNVGKTTISMAISAAIRARGIDIGVCKPMMSGMKRADCTSDASLLKEMSGDTNTLEAINPFQFDERVTPYIAAKRQNKIITLAEVKAAWLKIADTHEFYLVEGAGGLMAPMGAGYHVGHIAQVIGLPVVIVARPSLGTVNHTLLTIEAVRSLGLSIAGVIINGVRSGELTIPEQTNPQLIEEFSGVPIIGQFPKLEEIEKHKLAGIAEVSIDLDKIINHIG